MIQMRRGKGSFYHRSVRRSMAATCVLALASLTATEALAQDAPVSPGLALNRFTPAPAGDRMFGVQSPYVAGHLKPSASLVIDYARNPLALKKDDGTKVGAIVSDQLFVHLNVGFAIANRIGINLSYPLALYQNGADPAFAGFNFQSPEGVAGGDLRVGARVSLIGSYWDPFQLAVGGYIWMPTGNSDEGSFVGEGVRGLPQVIAGGRVKDSFVWSFDVGPDLRRAVVFGGPTGTAQGTTVHVGLGGGVLLAGGNLQIGPEVAAGFVVDNVNNTPFNRATNLEVLLDARYRFLENFEAGVAGGPGLAAGIGTPQFRVLGMVSYAPQMKKEVHVPPPPPDKDGDGIIDPKDACVEVPGVADPDPKKHGCPPDKDGDGIIDVKDACVEVPGVADPDPKKHGCPPDRDGDGIIDRDDLCPRRCGRSGGPWPPRVASRKTAPRQA